MNKIAILSVILLFTQGCALMQGPARPVEVRTIAEPVPMYHPPLPLEVQFVDVDWTVLTPELMAQYLKDIETGSAPRSAYFSLTSKEYENLSMNMAELKRYMKDSLHIIEYYREYDNDEDEEEKKSKD